MIDQIRELPDKTRSWIAVACLATSAVIGSLSYTAHSFWFIRRQTSFLPDLMSAVLVVFLILPLVRGNLLHSRRLDGATSICLLLLFYLMSIIAKMGLQGTSWTGYLLESPTFILMLFIVVAANFNATRYGEIALLAAIAIGGYNISTVSNVMGFHGWLFIVLLTAGTLLTLNLSKLWSKSS